MAFKAGPELRLSHNKAFLFAKVQDLLDESRALQSESHSVLVAQRENAGVRQLAAAAEERANKAEEENAELQRRMERQETLYEELRKMRGRDEEMQLMQELQQVRKGSAV